MSFRLKNALLILSFVMPLLASAFPTSYYASHSRLSSGRWVKIKVNSTGICQLSHDQLRTIGFDNPEAVAVFGYGGARLTSNSFSKYDPDDIKPTPVVHTSDGRMLFYGEAGLSIDAPDVSLIDIKRNLYDNFGYYFLTDSASDVYPDDDLSEPEADDESLTHHLSVAFVENDVQNPSAGGAIFHDKPFAPGEKRFYDFDITDFSPTSDYTYGRFAYYFAANNSTPTVLALDYPSTFVISSSNDGNAPLITQSTKFYTTGSGLARFTSVGADGIHRIGFSVADGSTPSYAALDKAYVIYPRLNRMPSDGNPLTLNLPEVRPESTVSIEAANASTIVFDVTDASRVTRCATSFDDENSSLTVAMPDIEDLMVNARKLIAFDTEVSYPSVTVVGELANQDLHSLKTPDMLIITNDVLYRSAERLAEMHRDYDGFDVAVVDQQQIFNEFSSGSRCAMAYRRFLKMLYDREPDKIRYVLLYGHSSWDNRNPELADNLLCYETENVEQARDLTKNYTSDKYFVMLDDKFNANRIEFGFMHLSIGRIDVASTAEADIINDKIHRFMQRPRSHAVYGNVLVFSDDGESQGHFLDAEETVSEMLKRKSTLTFTRVHNLIYPWTGRYAIEGRKAISKALRDGQGLMLYYGHSNVNTLTAEHLFDVNLIRQSPCDDYPFVMFASCETFGFDRLHSLGQALLTNTQGGAIGIVGASRSVYMDYNKTFATAVSIAYASAGPQTAIGDIVRQAHNYCIEAYASEKDRAINAMAYNLCGDPALRLGAPGYSVAVESIGDAVPAQNAIELKPLVPTTIAGQIVDEQGNAVNDFDGNVDIRVYDTPHTTETCDKMGYDKNKFPVTLDEKVLGRTIVPVESGKFKAEMTVPVPTVGEGNNRIVINALSSDGLSGAAACLTNCKFAYEVVDDVDITAPQIIGMSVEGKSCSDGDVLPTSFTLIATVVAPPSGIDLSQGIGCAPTLKLDDRKSYNIAANSLKLNADGTASFSLPIENLAEGRHKLVLTLRSNVGVTATRSLSFIVSDSSVGATLSVDNAVARKSATFDLDHSFVSSPVGKLVIVDASGRTVYTEDSCSFPCRWNLTDNAGAEVPDGRYKAFAILRDEFSFASTPKIEIVVIR